MSRSELPSCRGARIMFLTDGAAHRVSFGRPSLDFSAPRHYQTPSPTNRSAFLRAPLLGCWDVAGYSRRRAPTPWSSFRRPGSAGCCAAASACRYRLRRHAHVGEIQAISFSNISASRQNPQVLSAPALRQLVSCLRFSPSPKAVSHPFQCHAPLRYW